MNTENQAPASHSSDLFPPVQGERPGMLNVLTILTFIGCAISYIGTIYGYFSSANYDTQLAKMEEDLDKIRDNETLSKIMEGSIEMFKKTHEYRYILLLSGILFTTLCLIGALQMRKLKKSGFLLYTIGELAPIALTAALIGFSFTGGIMLIISSIVAVVFVLLYASQRKYLIYN